jgi:flagellar transcriptional activator FlhC
MRNKSVLQEAQDIQKAVDLIRLGARMQMLEAETSLSRERLLKLYKEVRVFRLPRGCFRFPQTGSCPGSRTSMHRCSWRFYRFVRLHAKQEDLDAIVQAYRLYNEHIESFEMEQVLSLTRAWTLIRFFDAKLLQSAQMHLLRRRVRRPRL